MCFILAKKHGQNDATEGKYLQSGCTHVYRHVVIGDIRNEVVSYNDLSRSHTVLVGLIGVRYYFKDMYLLHCGM